MLMFKRWLPPYTSYIDMCTRFRVHDVEVSAERLKWKRNRTNKNAWVSSHNPWCDITKFGNPQLEIGMDIINNLTILVSEEHENEEDDASVDSLSWELLESDVTRGSERHNFEEQPRGPSAPLWRVAALLVLGWPFPSFIGSLLRFAEKFRQFQGANHSLYQYRRSQICLVLDLSSLNDFLVGTGTQSWTRRSASTASDTVFPENYRLTEKHASRTLRCTVVVILSMENAFRINGDNRLWIASRNSHPAELLYNKRWRLSVFVRFYVFP